MVARKFCPTTAFSDTQRRRKQIKIGMASFPSPFFLFPPSVPSSLPFPPSFHLFLVPLFFLPSMYPSLSLEVGPLNPAGV